MPRTRKAILCWVTDRHALQTSVVPPQSFAGKHRAAETRTENITEHFTETITENPAEKLVRMMGAAAAAGLNWIQIREKSLPGGELVALVRAAVAATRGTNASILVNDRLDCAIAGGGAGIHLGESSLPVDAVCNWRESSHGRRLIVGVSCHSLAAAREAAARGAVSTCPDYIIFGPVFATPSKAAFGPAQGLARLQEVCASVGDKVPVIAIGGVTLDNAASCMAAGAAGVAAIRLFQEADDLPATVRQLRERCDSAD